MNEQTNRKLLLGTLALSVFLASMGTSMANLALPAIGAEFGIEFSTSRLVVLSYLLATTIFSLVVGRIADLKGRKFALIAGTSLFVGATALAFAAPAFWLLVCARIVQGIGAAALIVLPIVIATESVAANRTGRAIGLLATMSAVGTASGPSIGGFALASHGWRAVFLVMTLLGGCNLLLLLRLPFVDGAVQRAPKNQTVMGGIIPIFASSQLRLNLAFNLIVSAVMMATLIVGPYFLSKGLELSPFSMGLVMSAGPITSIISGQFSGILVDRFGSRSIVAIGFVQLFIGALSFVFLPHKYGALGFAASAVLLSLGYQLFLSANSTSVMKGASIENRGLTSGALSLSRNLGLIVGTSALGSVFDVFMKASGGSSSPTAVLHGLQAVFASAALVILASLLRFLINEQRSKNGTRLSVQIY